MERRHAIENRRDRLEMAAEAGYAKISVGSVLAGVLVAYGAFAILAAIAGGFLGALGVDTTRLSDNDWRQLGIGTGVAVAVSLLLAYLFGGYVAGRMARRAGMTNGLLVFAVSLLLAIGVGAAIGTQTDGAALADNLRSIGVPTSGAEYSAIGTFAGLGALLAMVLGSALGGLAGERWHGKFLTRALDPSIGASHDAQVAEAEKATVTPKPVEAETDQTALDIRDTSTTLDEDLAPEHSRTLH